MNWLNIEMRTLRSTAYLGSTPAERATWLNVLAHCCEQENGGRMEQVASWKDRQWQQVCGVTQREVMKATKLLTWDGQNLVVEFYPTEKEREVRARREAGREGGIRSGESRATPKQNGSSASSKQASSARTEGERKEKGKEGERERKEKEGASAPPKSPLRVASETDEAWICELEAMDCYRPVSVRNELGKAQAWAKQKRRHCTRMFFLNWLNRALESGRVIAAPARTAAPKHDPADNEF